MLFFLFSRLLIKIIKVSVTLNLNVSEADCRLVVLRTRQVGRVRALLHVHTKIHTKAILVLTQRWEILVEYGVALRKLRGGGVARFLGVGVGEGADRLFPLAEMKLGHIWFRFNLKL